MFSFFTTAAKAKSLGCTHHARFMGIIPGFYNDDLSLWVSRSDLLIPLEWLVTFINEVLADYRGEEPKFMFLVGPEI